LGGAELLEFEMLKKFLHNKEGQFAAITALCALPIFGAVAMSVDFSNLSRLRHDLKDSCDAANVDVAKAYVRGHKDNQPLVPLTKADLEAKARYFYDANFDKNYTNASTLLLTLPDDQGNTSKKLELKCQLRYDTMFGPVLALLTNSNVDNYSYVVEVSTMKMRNVAEIALVLDNSGSMADDQTGATASSVDKSRIYLLKKASKDLVSTLIDLGGKIHTEPNPVKFSIVPFSAAVNVGNTNSVKSASWMDTRGVSPIHHEHLNWGTPGLTNPTGYRTTAGDGAKLDASGNPLTRFSILDALQFEAMKGVENTASCRVWKYNTTSAGTSNANCAVFNRKDSATLPTVTPVPIKVTSADAVAATGISADDLKDKYAWKGCVEERPYPYNINDDMTGAGAKFVPMFAPDSFSLSKYYTTGNDSGFNNWWPDFEPTLNWYPVYSPALPMVYNQAGQYYKTSNSTTVYKTTATGSTNGVFTDAVWRAANSRPREADVAKYFVNRPYLYGTSITSATANATSTSSRPGQWMYFKDAPGPNSSCTTTAITPLTGSKTVLNAAIDAMQPTANTNVPEGIAWGWRTVSHGEPFSEGVLDSRKDIDKVVIVLTDGANTYGSISGSDYAGNVSNYEAFGYAGYAGTGGPNGTADVVTASNKARIFQGTTGTSSYTTAENQHMVGTVNLAIASPLTTDIESNGGVCKNIKDKDILLMTVGLDLNPSIGNATTQAATKAAIAGLKACAGRSRNRTDANGVAEKLFWNACSSTPNASCKSLEQTFKEIADELSNLRFTN
jgi:Putative Flp pilus-assembly TadE/G-like